MKYERGVSLVLGSPRLVSWRSVRCF